MMIKSWNQEGRSEIVSVGSDQELLQFFDSFVEKEPFFCELTERDYKLSICIRGDVASVQYSSANNEPPYKMAVTKLIRNSENDVVFFIGNEATAISARYALPLEDAKQAIIYFLRTGNRDPSFSWEDI